MRVKSTDDLKECIGDALGAGRQRQRFPNGSAF